MGKLKLYLCTGALLFMQIMSYAQEGVSEDEANKRIKQAISLPPDAAAFQKYSYYPVSLSTGIANISIPLFNIINGELAETITLDYHTGGIKVNERATKQGLGWLLNAGGMITRSIQGAQADEHSNGYLNKRGLLPSWSDPNITQVDNLNYPDLAFQDFCYNAATNPTKRKLIDLEPDVFSYKFGQKTGVFYFSSTGKIVTEGLDPIKIETSDNLSWFKITDEKGIVYMFELTQNSTVSNSSMQLSGTSYIFSDSPFSASPMTGNISYTPEEEGLPLNNGWNLTRIIHPNQVDIIYFDYTSISYYVKNKGSQILEYPYAITVRSQGGGPPGDLHAAIFETTSGISEVENILTKIRYGNNSIEFNYVNDRQDKYVPVARLSSIVSKDASGSVIKSVSLDNNSYFNSNQGTVSYNSFNNYETKRLKLKGLLFRGNGSEKPYSYRFEYEEGNLPVVNATAQDHWGYYNGKTGNLSLIPETKVPAWAPGTLGYKIIGNADRTASESHMKAFILKKIYYPTGGVQVYEYSSHKAEITMFNGQSNIFQTVGGLKVDRVMMYKDSLLFSSPEIKEYVYVFKNRTDYGRLVSSLGSEFNYGWKQTNLVGASINFITIGSSRNYSFDLPEISTVEYDKVIEYQTNRGRMINYKVSEFRTVGTPNRYYMAGGGFPLTGMFGSEHGYSVSDLRSIQDTHDNREIDSRNLSQFYPLKLFYPFNQRPVLVSEVSYDKTGKVFHRANWQYSSIAGIENVIGFSVNDIVSADLNITLPNATYTPAGRIKFPIKHNYFLYKIPIGKNRVSKEIISTYDPKSDNYIVYTKEFDYEPIYGFVRKTSTSSSDGKAVSEIISYPFDYSSSIPSIDSLLRRNIISRSILSQKIINEKTTDAHINKLNGLGQLISTYSFNKAINIVQQDPLVIVPTVGFEKEFDLSYLNGRLVNSKTRGFLSNTYLWSYNNQYPIAEIKNASYNSVLNLLGGELGITNFSNKPYPSNVEVNEFLAPLRNNLHHSLIKSSTYKPLIGVNTQTDEKGYLTSYDYDGFQQLKAVKNAQGHVVKSYGYSYTNKIGQVEQKPWRPGIYTNATKSAIFRKNDCGSGYVGSTIEYVVSAYRYFSDISQEEADLMAQNDIFEYGQLYVNFMGKCRLEGVFYSESASRLIRKNDCPEGMFGSEVAYVVPAERYTSTISQADADAKAEAEVNANIQGYANAKGFCELKGIKLVRETHSSEHFDVHVFEGFEVLNSSPFPLGYRSSTTLVNFLPGFYKLICNSPTPKRFTINGVSKIGTSVTFTNIELDDTYIVVTVSD